MKIIFHEYYEKIIFHEYYENNNFHEYYEKIVLLDNSKINPLNLQEL